jgi:hypothetical protein
MNKQRTLIGVAWLASLVAAYFFGGAHAPVQSAGASGYSEKSASAAAAARTGANAEERALVRETGDLSGGRSKVALLIAKAQLELGSLGEHTDFRTVLRALGPIADLDPAQRAEALAEVERTVLGSPQKMLFYTVLLGQWAETDGKAALAYAEEKLDQKDPYTKEIRQNVLAAWAFREPDAVWRWYETERKEGENEHTVGIIFTGLAIQNLDAALQRLSTLDDASRAAALPGIASSGTTEAARQQLLDRAATLPPEQRTVLQEGAAYSWAIADPEGAVAWIRSLPAEEQGPLRETAGRTIMSMNPALGAEFRLEGAEEKDKPQTYVWIAYEWAQKDSRAAAEWLMNQPQGPELDGARQSYANAVVQKDPAGAMDWAKSVQGEVQRGRAVEHIFQQWRVKDPTAAEAALDAAGLPPEKVQQLKESRPGEKPR